MREEGIDNYENAHIQTVAIELSRRREREPSDSRTLVKLLVLGYKWVRQSRQRVSKISTAMCENAGKQNSCGLKIAFVKI